MDKNAMRPRRARAEFLQRFDGQCETPARGIESMLSFYKSCRVRGCELDADGDMLLYQWGPHDWGNGEHFEIDITRQLMWDDRGWLLRAARTELDPAIWQLSLTYRFEPTDNLRALGQGNRWCHMPDGLSEFEEFIRGTDAFAVTSARPDGTRDLEFGSAE